MIKGVLLDVDGTLVLSNDAHAHSWVEAFKHFGYDVKFDKVRKLIGMGGDKLVPKLIKGMSNESGQGKKVSHYRTKLFLKEYAPKLQPTPGSRDLIVRLQEDGYKLIVASSAKGEELETLLEAGGVNDLLEHAATSSDVDNSKPEPDIVHAALEKLGLQSREALMIGDTPYDLTAASKAGVELIAVRCGGWEDKKLKGSRAIYDSPADILDHYDTSPFYKSAGLIS